jgi:hypothetical protein
MEPYRHLGATLTDVCFHAGVNYQHAVEPRVKKILAEATAATLSGLRKFFSENQAEEFFNWNGKKPRNLLSLIEFFSEEGIDTELDLTGWMLRSGNEDKLLMQPGFGKKSVDYLKMLLDIPSISPDRHIFEFLSAAGIDTEDYEEAKTIVCGAAEILQISPSMLDHSIWCYCAGNESTKI